MANESTMDKMHQMRLSVMARAYREQEDAPGISEMGFDERLAMIVDAEWDARRTNKRIRYLRQAGFPESDANPLDTAPYYAVMVAPGIHHTMGGVKINTAAEVLTEAGEAIPGLYAAGEVTGGVHGANRLGGNAVCDIIVYGRIAAQSAAEYIK